MNKKVNDLTNRIKLYGRIGIILTITEAIYVGFKALVFDSWVSPDPFLTIGIVGIMFILGYLTGISISLDYLRGVKTDG